MVKNKVSISKYVIAILIFNLVFSIISAFANVPDFYDHEDETTCHYEVTKLFADQFPAIDISDYNSATGPFYHIFMAFISVVFSGNLYFLRIINVFTCIVLLWLVQYFYKSQNQEIKNGFLAINLLFLSTSIYFLGPEVRLSTDNFALLLVMISIFLMKKSINNPRYIIINAFVIFLAAFTRQNCFWLGIPQAILLLTHKDLRLKGKLLYCGILGIPILLYIPVFLLWGGLVPPRYADRHISQLANIEALYYFLAVVGFFTALYWQSFLSMLKSSKINIIEYGLSAIVTFILLIMHPLRYQGDPQLQGGVLWNVSAKLPHIFGTSILFFCLVLVGVIFCYTLIKSNIKKRVFIFESMLLFSWMLIFLKNNTVYQKYYEPFIIIILGTIFSHFDRKIKIQYVTSAVYITAAILIAVTRFIV